jgi:hypothetical protein
MKITKREKEKRVSTIGSSTVRRKRMKSKSSKCHISDKQKKNQNRISTETQKETNSMFKISKNIYQ